MKKIILNLLCRGYSSTVKYSAKQLGEYIFILKDLFIDGEFKTIVRCNDNPFWSYENNKNRYELIADIKAIQRRDIKDLAYFRILNRFTNGDKYGIQTY